jgi:histidinol-phosphate aminotransferase
MSAENLARPEIRNLRVYETAVQVDGAIRLHANEASWSRATDDGALNRYPQLRPLELQSRLAERFGVAEGKLLATRGSSEAIDLLIRTFCQAGKDNIVISPPTFVMYTAFARIQGAEIIGCPLSPESDFAVDIELLLARCTPNSKLVFLCSPNSPTGNVVPISDIVRLLEARKDQSVIVVDEAYIEFSNTESAVGLLPDYDNLVVLRTLSKALALAGARCGAVIGDPALVRLLNAVLPPYALATPVVDSVLRALSSDDPAASQARIEETVRERQRLAGLLETIPCVLRMWPSQANFLLVQFRDLEEVQQRLQTERILIRDLSGNPSFDDFARITVGSVDENDRLLAALSE